MKSQNPFYNVIPLFKKVPERKMSIPDYLTDYNASMGLVKELTRYYHSRGYKKVKVWLETDQFENGRKRYAVRSNIVFTVPN
jgi:hypothetical protein